MFFFFGGTGGGLHITQCICCNDEADRCRDLILDYYYSIFFFQGGLFSGRFSRFTRRYTWGRASCSSHEHRLLCTSPAQGPCRSTRRQREIGTDKVSGVEEHALESSSPTDTGNTLVGIQITAPSLPASSRPRGGGLYSVFVFPPVSLQTQASHDRDDRIVGSLCTESHGSWPPIDVFLMDRN